MSIPTACLATVGSVPLLCCSFASTSFAQPFPSATAVSLDASILARSEINDIPLFENKRLIYAISESQSGITVDLNIGGSRQWDFTSLPKTREAYKKAQKEVPSRFRQFFANCPLSIESDITSTPNRAKFRDYVFFDKDSRGIKTRGLSSVSRVPFSGLKEVIAIYREPFDEWLLFPLSLGSKWSDTRNVTIEMRDPASSFGSKTSLICSLHSDREIVDQGNVTIGFNGQKKTVSCLVMHERVALSYAMGSKVEHSYYWINEEFGFVVYVAGMENTDVSNFDRAAGVASLIRIEDPDSKPLRDVRSSKHKSANPIHLTHPW